MKAAALVMMTLSAIAASDPPAAKEGDNVVGKSRSHDATTRLAGWVVRRTIALKGMKVSLSQPVLVARRADYLWFPTLTVLSNGELLARMSAYADVHVKTTRTLVCWSGDGGLTWSRLLATRSGGSTLTLPSGDLLLLPYYLRPKGKGVFVAPYEICPKGERRIRLVADGVRVGGWPRPDRSPAPHLGIAGFVFNGQTVRLAGGYLATLYGHFQGAKRYALVAAESADGVNWKIRSAIADEKCKLPGREGPCESAIARLKDGRILCVFRMGKAPYGRTYSRDEGKTWVEPVAMPGPRSVQPSLAVMKDGTVVLSGGRPGLYLWLNSDGTGNDWQQVDIRKHHNACVDEKILRSDRSSSYTEVVALDDAHLLYIYDRIPRGWAAIPKGSGETNSVWVVRVTLKRTKR